MLVLSAENVSKSYGAEPVLSGATLEIRAGQHVGLIGPNGCGKTTLMAILAGELEADGGDVRLAPSCRTGLLKQRADLPSQATVWEVAQSALAHLTALADRAHRAAHALQAASDENHDDRARQYDALHAELVARDGYRIDHKIHRVLEGLGFDSATHQQSVRQLSGGQQNRLMLARLLLEAPELMLLDEPSNHLDVEATEWLESYLADSSQAFLLVSHDRYFLDRVTTRTLELVDGQIDAFPGNYSKYKKLKAARLEVEQRTFQKQQEEIEKLKDFVRRHHHGQKHAQAEDRRKKLERIKPVPKPREISSPRMHFPPVTRAGDIVLRARQLAKRFDKPLFEGLNLQIQRGQRWGILGPNGSGKTTLLRCLLGELPPDAGEVTVGTGVVPGYFDQHLECVDADATAAEAIRPRHRMGPGQAPDDQQRRDVLAHFGITGDAALQTVRQLSGGQRNRVALARLAVERANLLILDEPTNHLDLWAREALENALTEFTGTLLLVSHDRYFLNAVCDHLVVLQSGTPRVIDGNYDTYRHLQRQETAASDSSSKPANRGRSSAKAARKRKFPYRKTRELEADIEQCEAAMEALHDALADPEVLRDRARVLQARAALEQHTQQLEQLYAHWEEAVELN